MKARFALLALAVVCAAPLAAQGGGTMGGGNMGGMRMARGIMNVDTMAMTLGMDADTKAAYQHKIDEYNKDMAPLMAYMRTARQGGGMVDADSAKKMTDARAHLNSELKEALKNADQKKKFDSIVAATPMGRGGRGGGL